MNYFQLYNAQKEAYVFLHSFILSVSSCVRMNRQTIRAARKALPSTSDAKEWGQGIPVPWFTGPPNIPFSYSSKEKSSYGFERNGYKTDTLGRVHEYSFEKP